jgi:hypothetical protein
VSGIRPLEPDDIPAVARLYERVMRSGGSDPPPAVEEFFNDTLLRSPWTDPELPSLVYEDDNGLQGFLASHPRRLVLDGKPVRLGVSGQLITDVERARPGTGALLMRSHMRGPQDMTLTDGATPVVQGMWERLGGVTLTLGSLGWTRVIRPARFAAAVAARRRGREPEPGRVSGAADALLSPVARRVVRLPEPEGSAGELTIPVLLELLERGRWSIRPDYDSDFLEWLFAQMAQTPQRGDLRRLVMRDDAGEAIGWAIYYRCPDGISQVQQIGALGDPGLVIDHVVLDAEAGGSVAVQGRLEPALVDPVTARRCLIGRSESALLQADDPRLLAAVTTGRPLLTRMEGEWWMGPHLIPGASASSEAPASA